GHLFSGPLVFTSNSDAVWHGPNPFSFLADQWENGPEAMLLCVPIHRALGRIPPGDFGLSDDRLAKRGGDLVYTGIQIIQLDAVLNHPETVFSLNAVWDDMLSRNAVSIATYPGQWCDVGRPENISLAAQLLDSPRV
ncbi:MAG: nucleotidyltransferase family protein, partial [Planktomarina sp.]